MGRDVGRRHDGSATGSRAEGQDGRAAVGRRTLVEAEYPALAPAMPTGGAAPTMHDAATAAIESKGSGAPVDPGVAAQVGAQLGADLGGVRVHHDAMAQQASAAMGARAFAHGRDVFLAAGEAPTDLGLMAHELTHVAQQGGAGASGPQRKVTVGEANSPAEREADAVAGAVTGGAAPAALVIDQGTPAPGQMLKTSFLAELRTQMAAAADADAGPAYAAIESVLLGYAVRPAAELEALVRRLAPASGGARNADAMVVAVMARLRGGVQQWRQTGTPPPEVASLAVLGAAPGAASTGAPADPVAARSLRAPDGRETLASLEAALGPGAPVAGGIAGRVGETLGVDVAGARVHTGPVAAAKAAEAGAMAFAAGGNIVLGAGAPAAGSVEGDALLAHELVHTAQQADAARDPVARRKPLGGESGAAEAEADQGAAAMLAAEHGGARAANHAPRSWARTDLQLQRCDLDKRKTPTGGEFSTVAPVIRAAPNAAAREAALAAGIKGATARWADLNLFTAGGGGPIVALRRSLINETGVGGPGRALDVNPYISLRPPHIESVWRAWAENPSSVEPWTLLAIWMKEGLSAAPAANTVPASNVADARAIYRSQYYFQNMGADHYIHFTATPSGDNHTSFAPGSGAAHDTAFRAGIAAQVAAGRLPRDISAEIDAQLTVAPAATAGSFTVTAGPQFDMLSLMLVDAYFRENRASATTDLAAHGTTATGNDLDAMGYMRWNMGSARFNTMLGRSMAGNRDPDGSTPAVPTWALHRQVKTGEWDGPRANAIRFQYYQQAFRYLFEAGY